MAHAGDSADSGALFLLDGMSLAFRAYYALPPELSTESGLVTNAVHGFVSMLLSIVRDHRPSHLAVAFDLPGGTFRDALVDDYKGGRGETPPDLLPQFDLIRDVLERLGVPVVSLASFEADDIMATLASRHRDHGGDVVVVTGDRDCFQLVQDPHVRVLYNRKGVSDYVLYDEAGIRERTGVDPQRYPMLASMRGDPSDNLPGVPGVGEKTAAKLLNQYGDLDGIFAHLDDLTPKLRENMTQNEQLARTNLEVMTLVRNVPVEVDDVDLIMGGFDRNRLKQLFEELEMKRHWQRLEEMLDAGSFGPQIDTVMPVVVPADREEQIVDLARREAVVLNGSDATDWIVNAPAPLTAVTDSLGNRVGITHAGSEEVVVVALRSPLLCGAAVQSSRLRGADMKPLLRAVLEIEEDVAEIAGDLSVAGYLVDASQGTYDLATLEQRYLSDRSASTPQDQGDLLALAKADDNLADHALLADDLFTILDAKLSELELGHLYHEVELPLVRVLARMEARGICANTETLRDIATDLSSRATALEKQIQELAGRPFKVSSTKQLQEVLYEDLGLPKGRKTKTGYSTDASTLENLRGTHAIVDALLEFRELDKLRSTYGESLIKEISPDGRIHATFRQTVARTGRLSSESPNLHNIPVRSRDGRRFREAFTAPEGWLLLVADYDQVELRIIAHLSEDPGLLSAFASGEDVHRSIAASVYGISLSEITHDQRERAKTVSYGLAYGMEAFGLAQRLGVDVGEAKDIMDRYFVAFPGLRAFMDRCISDAKRLGYTRTELGRIRPLPELYSDNRNMKMAAERQAMNAGIQGLAADIFKVALVRLDHALTTAGLAARLVLQVHDEVIVEAPRHEREEVELITRSVLESAGNLRVPLSVSLGWGETWGSAKG